MVQVEDINVINITVSWSIGELLSQSVSACASSQCLAEYDYFLAVQSRGSYRVPSALYPVP